MLDMYSSAERRGSLVLLRKPFGCLDGILLVHVQVIALSHGLVEFDLHLPKLLPGDKQVSCCTISQELPAKLVERHC